MLTRFAIAGALIGAALADTVDPLDPSGWADVPWGAPLPDGLTPEVDWPWGADPGARCGWRSDTLLCDDGDGVSRAYRRMEAAGSSGGELIWLRTAGLEWRPGYGATRRVDGLTSGAWAAQSAPLDAWTWATSQDPPDPSPAAGPLEVTLEGGEALGPALPGVTDALSRCAASAPIERLPVQALYDGAGRVRKVRVQGFPPEGVELTCVAAAVGAAARPEGAGDDLELMITLR